MTDLWYVRLMGETIGPMSADQLAAMIQEGRLSLIDWVRKGKDGEWTTAGALEDLPKARGLREPPRHTKVDAPRQPKKFETSGFATASLLLGILGLCCFPIGIGAIVVGVFALHQIKVSDRLMMGRGSAIAGMTLSGIGILLAAIVFMTPDRQLDSTEATSTEPPASPSVTIRTGQLHKIKADSSYVAAKTIELHDFVVRLAGSGDTEAFQKACIAGFLVRLF